MKTQTIYVDACTSTGIAIGRRNTYATEQIVFGLAPLVQQYGAGSAVLMVLRPTDTTPYPAVTSQSGTELTWTVSATDTSVPGTGECELYWYVDGGLAKSVIFPLTIQRDIITEPIDEPPEPYQTWVDDLTDLGAETLQNAQAAAQSATDAETAQGLAEDAKTAAETAQGKAETAQGKAETAQEKAETAQTAAEAAADRAEDALEEFTTPTASANTLEPDEEATASYANGHFTFGIPQGVPGDPATNLVQSVNGKTGAVVLGAGDIGYDGETTYPDASVGAELTTINSALSSLQSITEIIDTASGAIASFPDGSGLPMRSLVAEINPVQDLHGQSNPYPAGGGKNLVDYLSCIGVGGRTGTEQIYGDNTSISGNVLTITQAYASNGGILKGIGHPSLPVDTSFTVSFEAKSSDGNITFGYGKYGGGGTNQFSNKTVTPNTWASVSATFTAQGDDTGLFIQPQWNNTTLEIRNLQFEIGSSATAYAPYSNLCPISGWTGVTGKRTGKNLIDKSKFDYGADNNFVWGYRGEGFLLKGGASYVFTTNTDPSSMRLVSVDESTVYVEKTATSRINYTPTEDTLVVFRLWNGPGQDLSTLTVQLELGSTASAHEEYQGEAISVTFPSTVYGGSDEVISGSGTSTMGMVDLGDLNWTYYSAQARFRTTDLQGTIKNATSNSSSSGVNAICSQYKLTSYNGTASDDKSFGVSTDGAVCIKDTTYTDAATFKSAMSGVQLCYELDEPQTFTHDPQEVDTLVGQNNVFVDTGNVEVTYPADTKLYIDKKIAEALA